MPKEDTSNGKWKVFDKMSEQWPIFTGDFEYANEILAEKSSRSPWLVCQFLNVLGRSFGQVIFANNPISGCLIILAIGIADYVALAFGIYASFLSFVFSLLTRQDSHAILNGCYGFNPVLHGVVSAGCLPLLYPEINLTDIKFWVFLTIATLLSVYITSASANFLSSLGKYPLPSFSLPFNILQLLLIVCLLNKSTLEETANQQEIMNNNTTNNSVNYDLNWGETFSGTIVSLSQVYGLKNLPCACLMFLALFIYSPLMTGFAYMGSLIGTLMGLTFATTNQELYDGVWGYNGLLCMAALGSFCYALNIQSTLIGLASLFFCTALQHALTPIFVAMDLPILTIPFNLTTILFLLITTETEKSLVRPVTLSFPEKHRKLYKQLHDNEDNVKSEA